jgi:hypothetical protein
MLWNFGSGDSPLYINIPMNGVDYDSGSNSNYTSDNYRSPKRTSENKKQKPLTKAQILQQKKQDIIDNKSDALLDRGFKTAALGESDDPLADIGHLLNKFIDPKYLPYNLQQSPLDRYYTVQHPGTPMHFNQGYDGLGGVLMQSNLPAPSFMSSLLKKFRNEQK